MNNPLQLIQAMQNPQQFIQSMMNNSQVMQNPMLGNVLSQAQKGNMKEVENIARNLCKQKGIDADQMFNQIKEQMKL